MPKVNPHKMTMSFKEKTELYNFLQSKLTKENGSDFVTYEDGFSDVVIARRFGCNVGHVMRLRNEMIGKLRPNRFQVGGIVDGDTFANLERRVTDIEDYLTRQYGDWRATLDRD